MPSVLVTYSTKYGSTAEVAQFVGTRLEEHGATVRVCPVREVRDAAGYDAVVLGAPLYMGRWRRDAHAFLRRNRGTLATTPFAVFALGPTSSDEEQAVAARAQLDRALARESSLVPVEVGVFPGVIDPEKLRFPFNKMPAGDWRDWDAIEAWVDGVAGALGLPTAEVVHGERPPVRAPAF